MCIISYMCRTILIIISCFYCDCFKIYQQRNDNKLCKVINNNTKKKTLSKKYVPTFIIPTQKFKKLRIYRLTD